MIVFIVVVMSISGLLHWFLYARLVSALELTSPAALWGLRFAAVFLAFSYIIARSLERHAPEFVTHALHWISSVWLGLMWQLLWLTFLFFLVKVVMMLTGSWSRLDPLTVTMLGRYATITTFTLAVLICGYAFARANGSARVVTAEVPIEKITPELRQLKIVMASDFHAGVLVRRAEISRWARQINKLEPDVVLIPGDIVDGNVDHIIEFADAFHEIKAPLGVFVTTGNHEYYAGVQRSLEFYKAANFNVLMNEHVELAPGLIVAGIEDRTARQMGFARPDVERILGSLPKDRPVIFLNHTPETAEAIAAGNAGADLVLSGHTHNGQIWPFSLLTRMAFRFQHGLYNLERGYIFTSSGIGTWGPPMRLGAPPEIILIRLVGPGEAARFTNGSKKN